MPSMCMTCGCWIDFAAQNTLHQFDILTYNPSRSIASPAVLVLCRSCQGCKTLLC